MRSVILKFFVSERSEKKLFGPVKVSNPASPIVPHAGSANAPDVGRASVQESTPTSAGVRLYANGDIGTNSTQTPLTLRGPTWKPWPVRFGRQGPTPPVIAPPSPMLAVHGKPLA